MANNDESKRVDLMNIKDVSGEQMEGLQRSLANSDKLAREHKE